MIKTSIPSSIINDAKIKAQELGRLKHSIKQGEGNLAGFIGEYLVQELVGGEIVNHFDYDIISPSGHKIDVKTKLTTVAPRMHYNCSIATYYKQKCDYYYFVRVHKSLKSAWLLGYKKSKEYFQQGQLVLKGDLDVSNNFIAKTDSYALAIRNLRTDYEKII